MCVTRCNFFVTRDDTDICIFRAAAAAEEDGDYGGISVAVLFFVLGVLLMVVILYKKHVDRKVATKKENASVRYQRDPFGGDLAAMERNRDVEEGDETMEMQSLPPEARADVHANPDDYHEIQLADESAADHVNEFVNPAHNLNIDR